MPSGKPSWASLKPKLMWRAAFSIFIVALFLQAPGDLHLPNAAQPAFSSPVHFESPTVTASEQLSLAAASLAKGSGPMNGIDMACQPNSVWSTTCTASAAASGTPAIAGSPSSQPTLVPRGRTDASMAYDPALGFVLLFGGANATMTYPIPFPTYRPLGDTWAFSDGNWTLLTPQGSPQARWGALMAYDPVNRRMLLCDGNSGAAYLSDCWVFTGNRSPSLYTWSSLVQSPPYPQARAYGGMAYDVNDSEFVVFGGVGASGVLGDTWTYNSTRGWHQLTFGSGHSPSARSNLTMVYDSADNYVLLSAGNSTTSGGHQTAGGGAPQSSGPPHLQADTWIFRGGSWTNVTQQIAQYFPREGPASAYDGIDGYVLEFGGCVPTLTSPPCVQAVRSGDTWFKPPDGNHLTIALWQLRLPYPAPGPRLGASMAYDSADGEVVLFGGTGAWSIPNLNHPTVNLTESDTWTYWGGSWSQVVPWTRLATSGLYWNKVADLTHPQGREAASIVFDNALGADILFGGVNTSVTPANVTNDTWAYKDGNWTLVSSARAPPSRFGASMAYDVADGYVVLFGGCSRAVGCGTGGTSSVRGDTWLYYSNGTWQNVTRLETSSPSARTGASMTYDSATGSLLLFGGVSCPNPASSCLSSWTNPGDTWGFSKGQWHLLLSSSAFHPPGRSNASLAFFPTSTTNRSLLTQGAGYDVLLDGFNSTGSTAHFYNDTWEFNRGAWVNITSSRMPRNRSDAALSIDGALGTLVLFGGQTCTGIPPSGCTQLYDTWGFSFGNWTRLNPRNFPPARSMIASTYDQQQRFVLVEGGVGNLPDSWTFWTNGSIGWSEIYNRGNLGTVAAIGELPTMSYDGPDRAALLWTQNETTWMFDQGYAVNVSSTTNQHPPLLYFESMTYDEADGYVVLFGGEGVASSSCDYSPYTTNATWIFQKGAWTNISGWSTSIPNSRSAEQLVYDPTGGYVLMFGGYHMVSHCNNQTPRTYFLGDTWEFRSGTWANVSAGLILTKSSPPILEYPAITFDAYDGYPILYGGYVLQPGPYTPGDWSWQTWIWNGSRWWNMTTSNSPGHGGRYTGMMYGSMTYVPGQQGVFLFGGAELYFESPVLFEVPLNETWEFQGGHWTNLTLSLSSHTLSRYESVMVPDYEDEAGLLFGGSHSEYWPLNGVWELA